MGKPSLALQNRQQQGKRAFVFKTQAGDGRGGAPLPFETQTEGGRGRGRPLFECRRITARGNPLETQTDDSSL